MPRQSHAYLSRSSWAEGIPLEVVERSLRGSLRDAGAGNRDDQSLAELPSIGRLVWVPDPQLPLWTLHARVWKGNPDGVFSMNNPRVP